MEKREAVGRICRAGSSRCTKVGSLGTVAQDLP